jgi:hypothetical protein
MTISIIAPMDHIERLEADMDRLPRVRRQVRLPNRVMRKPKTLRSHRR